MFPSAFGVHCIGVSSGVSVSRHPFPHPTVVSIHPETRLLAAPLGALLWPRDWAHMCISPYSSRGSPPHHSFLHSERTTGSPLPVWCPHKPLLYFRRFSTEILPSHQRIRKDASTISGWAQSLALAPSSSGEVGCALLFLLLQPLAGLGWAEVPAHITGPPQSAPLSWEPIPIAVQTPYQVGWD